MDEDWFSIGCNYALEIEMQAFDHLYGWIMPVFHLPNLRDTDRLPVSYPTTEPWFSDLEIYSRPRYYNLETEPNYMPLQIAPAVGGANMLASLPFGFNTPTRNLASSSATRFFFELNQSLDSQPLYDPEPWRSFYRDCLYDVKMHQLLTILFGICTKSELSLHVRCKWINCNSIRHIDKLEAPASNFLR